MERRKREGTGQQKSYAHAVGSFDKVIVQGSGKQVNAPDGEDKSPKPKLPWTTVASKKKSQQVAAKTSATSHEILPHRRAWSDTLKSPKLLPDDFPPLGSSHKPAEAEKSWHPTTPPLAGTKSHQTNLSLDAETSALVTTRVETAKKDVPLNVEGGRPTSAGNVAPQRVDNAPLSLCSEAPRSLADADQISYRSAKITSPEATQTASSTDCELRDRTSSTTEERRQRAQEQGTTKKSKRGKRKAGGKGNKAAGRSAKTTGPMDSKNDAMIEPEARNEAVSAVADGDEAAKSQKAADKEVFMRALARNDTTLVDLVTWDLLLVCKDKSWRLHRSNLREKCSYFKNLLPPVDPKNPRITSDVSDLDPVKLGKVVEYLELEGWDYGMLDADDPINGRSILVNVQMYLAAKMVDCGEMFEFALCNIEDSTDILKDIIKDHTQGNIARFEIPLRLAILEMYSSPHTPHEIGALRLAMARLVDIVLMYMLLNPQFKVSFEKHWLPQIFWRLAADNDLFCKQGLLEAQPEGWRPFEMGKAAAAKAKEGKVEPEPSREAPRVEKGKAVQGKQ